MGREEEYEWIHMKMRKLLSERKGMKDKIEKLGEERLEWANLPSRKQVMGQVLGLWNPTAPWEALAINQAFGRITAEDVIAVHNVPVVRASSMDGIAVKTELFLQGVPDVTSWIPGKEYVRADTGDDFSDKYDAVIPIEQVTLKNKKLISIQEDCTVQPGRNIVPKGSYLKRGELLVKKGTKLSPSNLASLAYGGITEINVIKPPKIVFIPTGSELVPAGTPLERGKNIDSNSILVRHMIGEMGAEAVCYPIIKDDSAALERALDAGLAEADIVIINGGSSKGEEDYNARLLKLRGEVICHGVAAAPGKPICIAMIGRKPVINLPGPSLAAYYGLNWCIRGLINSYLGISPEMRPRIKAVLQEDIIYPPGMEILCKMELWQEGGEWKTRQVPFRKSTVVENLSASGQFITDPDRNGVHKTGEILEVEIIQ